MGLKSVLVSGGLLMKIIRKIDRIIASLARKAVYQRGRIDQNKIFVMTYDNNYNCNPSYIVDEIIKRNLPVEIVWVGPSKVNTELKDDGRMSRKVKIVRRGTFEMFEEQASSKIWIDNALNCVWFGIPKKKEQVYINTWHGSMGIKKLSGDRSWLKKASVCRKMTDFCVSNSKFEEDVYSNTFWKGVPVLRYGHPRNDILFDEEKIAETRKAISKFFKISPEKKLLLYAPTFRDNGNARCFDIDYKELKDALEEKFGGEWVILVRMHFKNRSISDRIEYTDWLKNASYYSDMQPLMAVADMGITDYSSWAYDFILTKRPVVLYVPDVNDYNQDRGFYFNINSTPFVLAHDNAELKNGIKNFDADTYSKKVDEFLLEKGCYEKGNASERVVDKIEEILGL